jgi:hypothetical protein
MECWWAVLWNSFVEIHVDSKTHENGSDSIIEESESNLANNEREDYHNN